MSRDVDLRVAPVVRVPGSASLHPGYALSLVARS